MGTPINTFCKHGGYTPKTKGVYSQGIETNILDERTLDLPEHIYRNLILCRFYIQVLFGETVEENTKAIIGAIKITSM